MTNHPLREVLRDNVKTLLCRDKPLGSGETGVTRLKALGFSNGTAQRIVEGTTSIGLDTLDELAARLGVAAWRLIQPSAPSTPSETAIGGDAASFARMLSTLSPQEQAAVQLLVARLSSTRQRIRQPRRAAPSDDA